MAFKEATRNWWMKVAGGKCQYDYYDEEKGGWLECNKPADEVHHIIPEGWQLARGEDPEHSVGLPLCRNHHSRNFGSEIFEYDSSMHPDIAIAFYDYHDWKTQEEHMAEIMGRERIDYSTSPFAEVSREHRQMTENGERYWVGDEASDQHYIQKMRDKATRYIAETGDKKPKTKEHPRTDRSKKKKWYSVFEEELET